MSNSRLNVWIALAVVATVALGTVAWPRDDARALRPYAEAPLVASDGLGDLRLGVTTLAEVLGRLGTGVPTALFSDTTELEFRYGGGGLTLRFRLGDACATAVQAMHGSGLAALRDARRFTRAHPECADERLTAIELAAGVSERGTLWRGESTAGVRLRMPREVALERLATVPGALDGPSGPPPDPEAATLVRFVDAAGLQVHFSPDRSAGGGGWIVARLAIVAVHDGGGTPAAP